jgi:L-threonylcarbamoyladenylate synthase
MYISKEKTIEILIMGSLVAIRSDTLYGLSCQIQSIASLQKIFDIKKRDSSKSFIILFDSIESLTNYIKEPTSTQKRVMQKFWPGELTLILELKDGIQLNRHVVQSDSTIAVRIPKNQELRDIIKHSGPIVSSSINLSGKESLTSSHEIQVLLGLNFPIYKGGSEPKNTKPSTIYCFKKGVLREGAVATHLLSVI